MKRSRPRNPKHPRLYGALSARDKFFETASERFWRRERTRYPKIAESKQETAPRLADLAQAQAFALLGSAPMRFKKMHARRWQLCFLDEIPPDVTFIDMFPEEFGLPPHGHPPEPPTEDDTTALNDVDAALQFLRILYLSKHYPEILEHEDRDSIIFLCGRAAGICEATGGLRLFEVAAERGYRQGISASKAAKKKHEPAYEDHDTWARCFVLLRRDQPDISRRRAAQIIRGSLSAKQSFDTIRKKLGQYEREGWIVDIEAEMEVDGR